MKQRALMVLYTVGVFASGFGIRSWMESDRPVPAPPVAATSPVAAASETAAPDAQRRAVRGDVERMVDNIRRWSAQIDEFNTAVARLDSELDAAFLRVLTDEQRTTWTERPFGRGGRGGNRGGRGNDGSRGGEPSPMNENELQFRQRLGLSVATRMLAIEDWIDGRDRVLNFSPEQKTLIRALLIDRRDKFIGLTEPMNMMSIQYSQVASQVERLAAAIEEREPATEAPAAPEPGK
jgi:hypothetical protein